MIWLDGDFCNSDRGNFDIVADILEASCGGTRKTGLTYHCNPSFKQLKYYSRFLVRNGLICLNCGAKESVNGIFEVTEKIMEFLKAFWGLKLS